jgi:ribosome-associated protein
MQDEAPLSKTKRKQQMHDLQGIGESLVRLGNDRLAQLNLPEELETAIREAKRIRKHEALRRQMQYIGRLMRDVETTPITEKLDAWNGASKAETAKMHLIERWRDQLLAEESAVAEFMSAYPLVDVQQLRTLIRNARKERQENKPPRNARLLFRTVKEALEQPDAETSETLNQDEES